jgi:hypothetical protein
VSNQPEVVEGRLTATVDRIVADARSGEQVEAFAMWEREASVRAYDGEVESFTAAELNGVGIRVIVEGRQGFAYCGTLDEDAIRDALADARDNARYAEPDEFAGLAQPDGVPVPRLDLFDARLLDVPADRKIALALELEASTRAADKRISGIESAEYVDAVRGGVDHRRAQSRSRQRLLPRGVHPGRRRRRRADRLRVLGRAPSRPARRRPRRS